LLKDFSKLIPTGVGFPHFANKAAKEAGYYSDLSGAVFNPCPQFVDLFNHRLVSRSIRPS
jgi:hypothetical protein